MSLCARIRGHRLTRAAADEATRASARAMTTGLFLVLLHWWQTR
ncbi:hypothetical protein [Streptomyces sp. RKAG293]|nr:hypothetical protein [Streptomyces sp. RKAG293]